LPCGADSAGFGGGGIVVRCFKWICREFEMGVGEKHDGDGWYWTGEGVLDVC
jgi:hypothetical protein